MQSRIAFTRTQRQRLIELGAGHDQQSSQFDSAVERDRCFDELARELRQENLNRLETLRNGVQSPVLVETTACLRRVLVTNGFVEVSTPTLLARGALHKMGLDESHPLWQQIYWVDSRRCLRPMLAPNLYFLLGHLQRLWPRPICIFEVGPCWRKESRGAYHVEDFTMLNLVELGCRGPAEERLRQLAAMVMDGIGLAYQLVEKSSAVYATTVDITVQETEVASGVSGPHPLDDAWEIHEPWAGLGLGIERLGMLTAGFDSVHRIGRSLIYLNGARLNL